MWVKICGNTNREDALLAAELGADAVGFVFAPSVRQVTAAQVARITPHLPPHVHRFGVFPAWKAEEIVAAVQEAGLTAVQLHAAFHPALARSLRHLLGSEIVILQALHWEVGQLGNATAMQRQLQRVAGSGQVDHILVDSKVGEASGGTGVPFDWQAARNLFALHPKLILAGGLRPQNVAEAIGQLQPWGVDVASGVERCAGRKDREKLADFINSARQSAMRKEPC